MMSLGMCLLSWFMATGALEPMQSRPETITIAELEVQAREAKELRMACGPLSLWYCLRRSGKAVRADELLRRFPDHGEGVSLKELCRGARQYGLEPRAINVRDRSLASLPVPAIIVIDDSHSIVFDGTDSTGQAIIFEPTIGLLGPESVEHLKSRWTGQAVVFGPSVPSTAASLSLGAALGMTATSLGLVLPRWRRKLPKV